MKQNLLTNHAKGEIKVKEKHTYVMYIVELNNVPSEGCDTSKAKQCGERISS
jgi:hypothetical protein